nr:glutathione s-transferase zeta class [Quercus suber]
MILWVRQACSFRVRIALNLKEFTKLNPIGYVPVIVDGDLVLSYSFAILLAANIVSSSIQPLQNLATLKYIKEKVSPDEQLAFSKHHIEKGFVALERLLKDYAGRFATGDEVFLGFATEVAKHPEVVLISTTKQGFSSACS